MQPLVKIGIILACAAMLIFIVFERGVSYEKAKFDAYKDDVKRIGDEQVKLNKEKEDASDKVTKQVANDWAANLNALRANYDARLRKYSSSSGVPNVPIASTGVVGNTADPVVATRFEEDCTITTLQLNSLQTWIKDQKEIYK